MGDDEQVSPLTSPSAVIARRQSHRLLIAALRKLRPEHREILTLSYWHCLSGAEVARMLGIPETTARSRIRAASSRLRAALERAPSSLAKDAGRSRVAARP